MLDKAIRVCTNIIEENLKLKTTQKVLLVHQEGSGSELNDLLTQGYRAALQNYSFEEINFDPDDPNSLKKKLFSLQPNDTAILVQNVNFRLSSFRIRLELKNKGVYAIEHTRLAMSKGKEVESYLNALTYDYPRYKKVSEKLLEDLKTAREVIIVSTDDSTLTYTGPFEEARSNIGELNKTLGGFYPIGEVFTEPKDLANVNGTILVYAFPNKIYETTIVKPFKVTLKEGCIISHEGAEEFEEIVKLVREENSDGKVWVREMGFGLNKYINKKSPLTFVSAHERQEGFHISLGLKHGVYRKKLLKSVNQQFHIDLFVDLKKIQIDKKTVWPTF
jgi:aminopeptidase